MLISTFLPLLKLLMNLQLCLFMKQLQVARYGVGPAQVPLCELGGHAIRLNSFMKLFQKLLLNAQVVVRDSQHRNPVFELFLHP